MLTVVCYDIADDRRRRRIAAFLEDGLVRVQESVFEARLTRAATRRLASRLRPLMGPGDNVRIYAVAKDGLARCETLGGAPMMSEQDYWLL